MFRPARGVTYSLPGILVRGYLIYVPGVLSPSNEESILLGSGSATCHIVLFVVVRKGASPLSMGSLCGVGDLVLTCTGSLSRNWTVGHRLAKGEVGVLRLTERCSV